MGMTEPSFLQMKVSQISSVYHTQREKSYIFLAWELEEKSGATQRENTNKNAKLVLSHRDIML